MSWPPISLMVHGKGCANGFKWESPTRVERKPDVRTVRPPKFSEAPPQTNEPCFVVVRTELDSLVNTSISKGTPVGPVVPTVYYLAYGSNLHPMRLAARVPSARAIGVVEMLGFFLAFHKRSTDGSGKCLFYTEQGEHYKMYGVIYEFDAREKSKLDLLEGNGKGYYEQLVKLPLNGDIYTPYIYIAESTHIDPTLVPYHWYKQLVLAGARYHNFPVEYVAGIESTPSKADPDLKRTQENESLLRQMGQV